MTICISVIVLLVVVKVIWVLCATNEIGSFESEKNISDGMITLTLASIKNNLKVIEA